MNKTETCKISAICLTFFALFLIVVTDSSAAEYVSVIKDGINIRSGPTTTSPVLWEVFEGFPYEVVERKDDWAKVKDFEGDSGWIYAPLLSDKKTVIVKVDSANMRSGPGKDSTVIATVKKGVVFDLVGREGGWLQLNYKDNLTGWIYNTLLWPSNP